MKIAGSENHFSFTRQTHKDTADGLVRWLSHWLDCALDVSPEAGRFGSPLAGGWLTRTNLAARKTSERTKNHAVTRSEFAICFETPKTSVFIRFVLQFAYHNNHNNLLLANYFSSVHDPTQPTNNLLSRIAISLNDRTIIAAA